MKIFESMGNFFGEKEPSPEEKEKTQKKEYITGLETRVKAMKEAREQWQGATDTRIDAREISALETRIAELKNELGEEKSGNEEKKENGEESK